MSLPRIEKCLLNIRGVSGCSQKVMFVLVADDLWEGFCCEETSFVDWRREEEGLVDQRHATWLRQ